jgi:speckle-type POZ protein
MKCFNESNHEVMSAGAEESNQLYLSEPNSTIMSPITNDTSEAPLIIKEIETGCYQFKVQNSRTKHLSISEFIPSPIFNVSGYDCEIRYYPRGCTKECKGEFISLYLAIHCNYKNVTASFAFGLLDLYGNLCPQSCKRLTFTFSSDYDDFGSLAFMKRSDLEDYYVRNNFFTLVCSITIISESCKEVPKSFMTGIRPGSLNEHFGELLERREGADVTFEVKGQIFIAHRSILATRSAAFKGELLGPISDIQTKSMMIKIEDMKPVVFKAMLHFIYTDSLPDLYCESNSSVMLLQDLIAAANRYALDGLKERCEERLIRDITLDTFTSILSCAEENDCNQLRDFCFDFASEPENLVQLTLKDEYIRLMQRNPSLLAGLRKFTETSYAFQDLIKMRLRGD